MSIALDFSGAISAALDGQKGNSIPWGPVKALMNTHLGVAEPEVNFAKVSSREENYYVRLNQSGFRSSLQLGVIVSVGVPFSANVAARLKHKVSPHPRWPLLVFQDVSAGSYVATDVVRGETSSDPIVDAIVAVWPTVVVHEREDVWSGITTPGSSHVLSAAEAEPLVKVLQRRKNVVLEGVPGTGKSFAVRAIASAWKDVTGRELAAPSVVVLHPSSSYEDLVEGLRPGGPATGIVDFTNYPAHSATAGFQPHLGRFAELCRRAAAQPDVDFLLVLDELNRANVPKAMGELMLVLDRTKRASWNGTTWDAPVDGAALLSYTGVRFWVPENVHVLGTMNTTDRSVAPLDAALRRRFDFLRLEPMSAADLQIALASAGGADPFLLGVLDVWKDLNEHVLRPMIGPDAVLGHSYLFELRDLLTAAPDDRDLLARTFLVHTLVPQLIESVVSSGREGEIFGGEPSHRPTAVQDLDELLGGFGMALRLQGDGLGRRVAVVPMSSVDEPPEPSV